MNSYPHREQSYNEKWGTIWRLSFVEASAEYIHREDGPAIEWDNGEVQWRWHGRFLEFDEWLKVAEISDEKKVELKLKYG